MPHDRSSGAVRMIALALSSTVLALVAGCATSAATDPTATSGPRAVQPIGPFNGLLTLSAAWQSRLQTTNGMLVARCMSGRSFDYVAPKLPTPVDATATTNDYDLIAPETASAEGYGLVDNALTNKTDDAVGSSPQPQAGRPGFTAALTGTATHRVTLHVLGGSNVSFDSDGCVTKAIDELYGSQWNRVYFGLEALVSEIEHTVETSKPWTTAVANWSKCMNSRYHVRFSSPNAARSAVANSVNSAVDGVSVATAETRLHAMRFGEVTLAAQDATCQQSVDLAAVAQQAQNKAQADDAQKYGALLNTYAAELAHAEHLTDSMHG